MPQPMLTPSRHRHNTRRPLKLVMIFACVFAALLEMAVAGSTGHLTAHAAAGPQVYTVTYRSPDDPARCAALIKLHPQLAGNSQGCNFVVTEKVIVKHAAPTATQRSVLPIGGGCTPYSPDADVTIDETAYGSYQLYEIEQDTEFIGDGCSTPGFGYHHCYADYSAWSTTVSTSWCDTSTDPNDDALGHAGFWVSQAVGSGYTAKIDTVMAYQMTNWYSNCSPMNCNT